MKSWPTIVALAYTILIATGCNNPSSVDKIDTAAARAVMGDMPGMSTVSAHPDNWIYDTTTDEITSKKMYFATVTANDLLYLNFPYNGGSVATIMIQHRDGANSVLLQVTKGQFMATGDPEEMRVRFDSTKAETYYGIEPNDRDSKALFITPSDRFIARLKKSKKVVVRLTMYNDGQQTMIFNSDSLIWKH